MRLYGWALFILDHHAANFGGFRDFTNGGKTFLICHVISKDHVFKGLCNFMDRSTPHRKSPPCHEELLIVTHQLAKINGQRTCCFRDILYLMCHVTLQDHVIKEFYDFMEGTSSSCSPPAAFGGHSHYGSGDIFNL